MSQVPVAEILNLLHELAYTSYFQRVLGEMWNAPGQEAKDYSDRDAEAKSLAPAINSVLSKYQPGISMNYAFDLGWFLLMLPLEVEHIDKFNFKPIFPFIEDILKSLILECRAVNILNQSNEIMAYQCLKESALVILRQYQDNPLPKLSGAPSFYADALDFDLAENFALACPAFFNWRAADHLEKKINRYFSRSGKRKAASTDKKLWVPFRHVEDEPYSLMRRGLNRLAMRAETGYIVPEDFMTAVETDLAENQLENATYQRQFSEFKKFRLATRNHRTLWQYSGELERIRDFTSALEDEASEEGEGESSDSSILITLSGGFEEEPYGDGMHEIDMKMENLGKKMTEDEKHNARIEHMVAAQKAGGLVRLRYSWDSVMVPTLERLGIFIGWLTDGKRIVELLESGNEEGIKKGVCALAFLESLSTGAGIKRIMGMREPQNLSDNIRIRPAGLYLPLKELAAVLTKCDLVIPPWESLYEYWKEQRKKFASEFPEFKFGTGPVAYAGRAWLIDCKGFNVVEASHIAGVILPGARATMQYMEIENPIKKLHQANKDFYEKLFSVSQNAELKGFRVDSWKYLRKSRNVFLDHLKSLELIQQGRHVLWPEVKPDLRIPSEQQVKRFIENLNQQVMESHGRDRKQAAAALIVGVSKVILGIRSNEALEKGRVWFSFVLESLLILTKGNKEFAESRCLPVPQALLGLIYEYWIQYEPQHVLTTKLSQQDSQTLRIAISTEGLVDSAGEAKRRVKQALNDAEIFWNDHNCLRRFFATEVYRKGLPFDHIQALLGHSQVGFEIAGPNSRRTAGALRRDHGVYAAAWGDILKKSMEVITHG